MSQISMFCVLYVERHKNSDMEKQHLKKLLLTVVSLMGMTVTLAQNVKDSVSVKADSVAYERELEEVSVVRQRQLIKSEIDRTSYNVQADEESKTLPLMDMLRKVPLVTIDGEDNIKVKGTGNFKIYKNGRPDLSLSSNPREVLKTIPASMVKRIEVITEPGAKEDAEGVEAILNIVMMENQHIAGVTGAVTERISESGAHGTYGFLTTQIGKFIMSANFGYNHQNERRTRNHTESERVYGDSGNRLFSERWGSFPGNVLNGNIEASYDIDSLNLLTLSFGGFSYELDYAQKSNRVMTDAAGNLIYRFSEHNQLNPYQGTWNGRLDFQHKTRRPEEVLTFSYMFSMKQNSDYDHTDYVDGVNMPMTYNSLDENSKLRFYEHTWQADWVRPMGKSHKLELGAKYISRQNRSHTWLGYGEQEPIHNRFNHQTNVGAAYMQYMYTRNRWSARAGLRYEYSYMSAKYPDGNEQGFHKHFHDFVPSASLNYKISDANSLKFAFSTSINRPGIMYLNPAVTRTPTQVSFGNEHLGSSQNMNFGLTFMHVGAKLTYNVRANYLYTNHAISSIQYVEDGILHFTYGNVLRTRMFGFPVYVQMTPWKNARLSLNAAVHYRFLENRNTGMCAEGWWADGYVNFSQKLMWNIHLNVNGGGQLGHYPTLYSYGAAYHYYSFRLQRSFLKDNRLTVSLTAFRPFDGKMSGSLSRIQQGDFTGYDRSRQAQRSFSLMVSYRFGKLKASVKKTKTTIENTDVVGGLKGGN